MFCCVCYAELSSALRIKEVAMVLEKHHMLMCSIDCISDYSGFGGGRSEGSGTEGNGDSMEDSTWIYIEVIVVEGKITRFK